MQPHSVTVTGKRKQDYASLDFESPPKLARHAPPEKNAPVMRTRPDALHALPPELLAMIVDRVIPDSPYLARPYGENVGHFPVAPAMRALGSWGSSCTAAHALIATVRKDPSRSAFRTLASSFKFELLGKTPLARDAAIEQYGIDPASVANPYPLLLQVGSPSSVEWYANVLQKRASGLEKLELYLNLETYPNLATLASALRQCTGLKVLSLHWSKHFPLPLLAAMHSLPALRSLALHGSAFPADLFAQPAGLPACAELECLSVTAPNLSRAQLQALATSAGRLVALRFLALDCASLDADACAAIADACRNMKRLESLEISALAGADSVCALMPELASSTRVTRLGLHRFAVDQSTAEAMFSALGRFSTLHELRLSGPLQQAAAKHIPRLLSDPTLHLQALDLECADLDEAGVVALADAFRACPWLHELRLAHVKFTEASAVALAQTITASRGLLKLTLDKCDIELMVHSAPLRDAFSASTTLRELHIQIGLAPDGDSNKTDMLGMSFSYAAKQSSSLLHMTLFQPYDGIPTESMCPQTNLKLAQNRRRLDSESNYRCET